MSQTRIGITPRDDRSRQCIDAAASQGTPGTAVHDHKPERGQERFSAAGFIGSTALMTF